MILCEVKKCLPNNVYVLGAFDEEVELVLEFFGVKSPMVGDSLVLHEDLFDITSETFTQPYSFELFDKEITNESELDKEMALLKTNDKIFVLKRIYG